jgi:hypothetical protein
MRLEVTSLLLIRLLTRIMKSELAFPLLISGTSGIVAIVNSHFETIGLQGIELWTDAIITSATANGNIGDNLTKLHNNPVDKRKQYR